MKNIKLYIAGVIILLVGLTIGWLVKPTNMDHHHPTEIEAASSSLGDEIWTCSMHPQIRKDGPGLCPICEMDLIPLDNSLGNDDPTILRMSKEAAKLAQIETFIVGGERSYGKVSTTAVREVQVDGTVELDERSVKSQTAHLSGRIETMSVTFEGQYISAGQQIATIYSTDLLAASQELLTAVQFNDKVEGLKDAAIQKLKNWKITDSQIQNILTTQQPIETITIYADHSGYLLSKNLSQGDYVQQGQALYTVGSTGWLWLMFNVFESDLAFVKVGNKVTFTTPSLPNEEFEAKITYINPLLKSSTRTAVVRAEISNKGNKLKPGMLLKGNIKGSKSSKSVEDGELLTIPSSAVLWTGNRSVVYVQVPDTEVPTYEFREVEVSNRSGKYTTVLSGINAGEQLVTEGAFAVDAAAQLNNNFSMMNRDVRIKKDMQGDRIPSFEEETPEEFQQQLDKVVLEYIDLKNTLVSTDFEQAGAAAEELLTVLSQVDMSLLKGDAHMFWMEQLNAMNAHAGNILKATDIEEQRDQFDFLSQAVINSLKAFGTNDETYYVQHCPMANNNAGADWLSTESEIRNPYFGDKMMKCGSVKLELQ